MVASGSTVELTVEGMHCAALRGHGREVAERARRRRGFGEPRDRARVGRVSAGAGRRRSRPGGREHRLRRARRGRRRARGALPASASPDRGRRADRAARRYLDDSGASLPRLGVGRARARDSRGLLVRLGVPPGGARLAASPRGDDGHARLARDAGGLVVVGGRARGRRFGGHLLRGRRRRDDADPARPVPGGAGEAPLRRRLARARPARREAGARASGRRRGGDPGRGVGGRRPVRRASRREARSGRRRRGRRLGARPVDADRRARSRGGRARREGGRRDDEHVGAARRARNPRRRGHGGRADRAARDRGPVGEGARAAARRPDLGRVRTRRRRALAGDARRLAPRDRRCERGVHGRRRPC